MPLPVGAGGVEGAGRERPVRSGDFGGRRSFVVVMASSLSLPPLPPVSLPFCGGLFVLLPHSLGAGGGRLPGAG